MANIRYVVKVYETFGTGPNAAQPFWKEIKTYRNETDAISHADNLAKGGHRARVFERDLDDE